MSPLPRHPPEDLPDHPPDHPPDPPPGDHTYRDALPHAPAHRRGAALNPGNRFESVRLHVLGEELDRQWIERESAGDGGRPTRVQRTVFEDKTRSIINKVQRAPDIPFDWTVNPYRGCEHGCVYCFARQYHEYLGFSCGLDFETKLMAKPRAAELLQNELAHPRWRPEPIVMSASTDIYQPIEHELRIARQCLQVMADAAQPVSTMTKSAMVLRDTDLWSRLASLEAARITITIVTLDDQLARSLEPRASSPAARLRAIRQLTDAGIPVTLNIAPVIPGLTDHEIPAILEAAAEAGAISAAWVLLRLPYQLKDLFLDWLQRSVHPDRAKRVESLIRQSRGGKLYDASHNRGRGDGPLALQIAQNFRVFARRHHLDRTPTPLTGRHFTPPQAGGQMPLFN
ncbi:MAG: PA0069 family radical SAM protein [Phycisphaerales bacterium]